MKQGLLLLSSQCAEPVQTAGDISTVAVRVQEGRGKLRALVVLNFERAGTSSVVNTYWTAHRPDSRSGALQRITQFCTHYEKGFS